jgi:HNH endonuclease
VTNQMLPEEFLEFLKTVKGKRSKVVIQHILDHGFITTEDLEITYGYKHPPRAVRDVREQGIPLETFTVKNSQNRSIAAYRFAATLFVETGKAGGRRPSSKAFKVSLFTKSANKCTICSQKYEERYLQVDHRDPYEVAGNTSTVEDETEYMLLCGSCNRAKSWSCEHCNNWLEVKDPAICKTCYWANPIAYAHIALRQMRRLEVVWVDEETDIYDSLKELTNQQEEDLPEYVKDILRKHLASKKDKL